MKLLRYGLGSPLLAPSHLFSLTFKHVLILHLVYIPYTDHCIVYTQSEINANKRNSEFLHGIKECHDLNHFLVLFPIFFPFLSLPLELRLCLLHHLCSFANYHMPS